MSFWLVHLKVTGSLMNKKYANIKKFYQVFFNACLHCTVKP